MTHNSKSDTQLSLSWLEKIGSTVDEGRKLFTNFGRLAFLMSKGAYLVEERRRLFQELGEFAYEKLGRNPNEPMSEETRVEMGRLIHYLDRVNKKIELEEILVRQFRFGQRPKRNVLRAELAQDPLTQQQGSQK